ncbi:unnamed protein product [Paramecium pentaurelia]|uniref:Uncharacterized protein n=1 Tax=Paramecium pentaurelia TaxID=43138 RepID=A0A8S1TKC0_9CILI|nr:unnamed protein product [Paramecium pentaurelia]
MMTSSIAKKHFIKNILFNLEINFQYREKQIPKSIEIQIQLYFGQNHIDRLKRRPLESIINLECR